MSEFDDEELISSMFKKKNSKQKKNDKSRSKFEFNDDDIADDIELIQSIKKKQRKDSHQVVPPQSSQPLLDSQPTTTTTTSAASLAASLFSGNGLLSSNPIPTPSSSSSSTHGELGNLSQKKLYYLSQNQVYLNNNNNNNSNNNNNPYLNINDNTSKTTTSTFISAHAAHKTSKFASTKSSIDTWEQDRLNAALGYTSQVDLDDVRHSMHEQQVVIYAECTPPSFLIKLDPQLAAQLANLRSASLFRPQSLQVTQNPESFLLQLAKTGRQSLTEYYREKARLTDYQSRFWELHNTQFGKFIGATKVSKTDKKTHEAMKSELTAMQSGTYCGNDDLISRQLYVDGLLYNNKYESNQHKFKRLWADTHTSFSDYQVITTPEVELALKQKDQISTNNTLPIIKKEVSVEEAEVEAEADPACTKETNINKNKDECSQVDDDMDEIIILKHVLLGHSRTSKKNSLELQPSVKPDINEISTPTTDSNSTSTTIPITTEVENNNNNKQNNEKQLDNNNTNDDKKDDNDVTLDEDARHMIDRAEIRRVRQSLPVYQQREKFLRLIRDNNILIVVGETGSGKTTQLAQYLYESGYATLPKCDVPLYQGQNPIYKEKYKNQQISSEKKDEDVVENDYLRIDSAYSGNYTSGDASKNDLSTNYIQYKRIGVTQPRQVAAKSVAARVAEEMDVALGTRVGYAVRFDDAWDNTTTAIKFMTDGVLLRETLGNSDLEQYSCIIMDEAHERSLNTDILFGLLRDICSRRNDLKLIVTSATLNAEQFSAFFGYAPILHIAGRTFDVDIQYLSNSPTDYIRAAATEAIRFHIKCVKTTVLRVPSDDIQQNHYIENVYTQPTGDILIFMTGRDDVEATCFFIWQQMKQLHIDLPLWIIPLTASSTPEEQRRLFMPSTIRKCIVATNVAETSLTIDGVRYVIDCGFSKLKTYNPSLGVSLLTVTPISRANANQRAGRAGRTSTGICLRLYRQSEYEYDLLPTTIPEIFRSNLISVVLTLKAIYTRSLNSFPFFEKPQQAALLSSLFHLWLLSAIDTNEGFTPIGHLMSLLPLEPQIGRILIEAIRLECVNDIVTLCAMIDQAQTLWIQKKSLNNSNDDGVKDIHQQFSIANGDFSTLVNVFYQWTKNNCSQEYAEKHYINYKSLLKARDVREQLLRILEQRDFIRAVVKCFSTPEQQQQAQEFAQIAFQQQQQYNNNYTKRKYKTLQQLENDNNPAYCKYMNCLTQIRKSIDEKSSSFSCLEEPNWERLARCVCSGYFPNAAKLCSGIQYQNILTGLPCQVGVSSTLGQGYNFVVYQDVTLIENTSEKTQKSTMRMVCAVEPQWLLEYGKMMYHNSTRSMEILSKNAIFR